MRACVCVCASECELCIAMTFSIANNTIKWIYVRHAICIHKILDIPDTEPVPLGQRLKLCNVEQS